MQDKAAIRKDAGSWKLTRPGFGFHGPTSTPHDSQADAIGALYQRQVSGGSATINETTWVPVYNQSQSVRTQLNRSGCNINMPA